MDSRNSNENDTSRFDKLEWINLRKELNEYQPDPEGVREKLVRKIKQNPFVPIGALATAGVLSYGLWTMKSGNVKKSQIMMRLRVVAQGFTVAAILVGMVVGATKKS